MPNGTLTIGKLTPLIGAEIEGIDLSVPMDEAARDNVRRALLDNLVVFFPNQILTPEEHKALGRRFGELHIHPAPLGTLEGHPEIMTVKADANTRKIAGETWHSDVSCDATPPLASMLYITEVPSTGGDTLFASMYEAYNSLSEPMQRLLADLTAIHDGARNYEGRRPARERGSEFPHAEHPVIRTHPETGGHALFVNRMFTTRIVQLEPRESEVILEMLFRHIENPRFQCRFR